MFFRKYRQEGKVHVSPQLEALQGCIFKEGFLHVKSPKQSKKRPQLKKKIICILLENRDILINLQYFYDSSRQLFYYTNNFNFLIHNINISES
jgi:hypothetical protein